MKAAARRDCIPPIRRYSPIIIPGGRHSREINRPTGRANKSPTSPTVMKKIINPIFIFPSFFQGFTP